jgi:hypothetical protein
VPAPAVTPGHSGQVSPIESRISRISATAASGDRPGGGSLRAMSMACSRACGSVRSCIHPWFSHPGRPSPPAAPRLPNRGWFESWVVVHRSSSASEAYSCPRRILGLIDWFRAERWRGAADYTHALMHLELALEDYVKEMLREHDHSPSKLLLVDSAKLHASARGAKAGAKRTSQRPTLTCAAVWPPASSRWASNQA